MITKTIRINKNICDFIDKEADAKNVSAADVIRTALADYFLAKQFQASLLAMEQRIVQRIDTTSSALADGITEILDLASPEGGAR